MVRPSAPTFETNAEGRSSRAAFLISRVMQHRCRALDIALQCRGWSVTAYAPPIANNERYMRSGAVMPMRVSARASVIFAARQSCRRAFVTSGVTSSPMTRHSV